MKTTENKSTHSQQHTQTEHSSGEQERDRPFFSEPSPQQTPFFNPGATSWVQGKFIGEQTPFFSPSSIATIQRKCATCEAEASEQQKEQSAEMLTVQRMPAFESDETPILQTQSARKQRTTDVSNLHETATEGIAQASTPLPGASRIQASFGHHDISGVRTQIGGPAAKSSEKMGAHAYTVGDRIGFRSEPDIRLAAHEAAHVVQQRRGVQLKDGIGWPGDPYEQQADAVAERVASNQSAETLLDGVTHSSSEGQSGLQAKCNCGGTCPKCAANLADEEAAPIQMALEVNAHHLVEDAVASTAVSSASEQGSGGGESSATEKGAEGTEKPAVSEEESPSEEAEENGGESEAATTTDTDTSSSPSNNGGDASATAPTDTSTPAPSAEGTEAPGGGVSPQGGESAAPASQGNVTATSGNQAPAAGSCTPECYRAPREEPAEEPEGTPSNPPPAQVEAEASAGDEEDLPEIDECPTEQADAAVAAAATSESPEAAMTEAAPTAGSDLSTSNAGAGAEGGPAGASSAAGGGAAQGTMSAAGGSPLDGVIAAAESQRSVAVSAYGESSAALSGVSARTGILRSGVRLVARSGESEAQQEQRRSAAGRADRFFATIADKLDKATAYALGNVPDQLGTTAESAKAQIGASIEQQKTTISARIAQAREQAIAKAAMARSAVRAQAAAYIADVESQTAAAIESLTTTHADTIVRVNELETSTLDSINEIYAQGRTDLEGLGSTIGNECTAKGREFATTYEGFANCTEDGFWDGNLAERRAKAQAEAARSVGDSYHDRMVEAARKRAREVTRNGRKTDRCSIIAAASRSRDTLDEQLPKLINAFEMTRDASIQQAGVTKNSLITSINSSLTATLSQLDQQEQSQRQAVNDTGYMQQVLQEQIAHAAASAVQRGVQTAVSSVQDAMLDVQARFATSGTPDTAALENALLQVEQNINTAMEGLNTSVSTGTTAAEAQLADAVQQAITSLEGITQSNDELTATLSSGFGSAMNGIAGVDNFATQRTTVTKQIQQSLNAGNAALTQTLEGLQKSCDNTIKGARTTLIQAHQSLEQNLRQSKQGLECDITRKADKAASEEAPAWKKVLAVVLVIIVIIIVIAVTVVTAGAAGPLIVAALGGPLLAGAIIGAAVGAVVSGLIAMASNLWNNRDVMEGVGKAVLVGFITGAAGGFIGATAGAGAGALTAGSKSIALKIAAQFGAAIISGGGVDAVSQYVMNGFSFENFSLGQLGITVLVTAVTFGIGYAAGSRAGTPTVEGPDADVIPINRGRRGSGSGSVPGEAPQGPVFIDEGGPVRVMEPAAVSQPAAASQPAAVSQPAVLPEPIILPTPRPVPTPGSLTSPLITPVASATGTSVGSATSTAGQVEPVMPPGLSRSDQELWHRCKGLHDQYKSTQSEAGDFAARLDRIAIKLHNNTATLQERIDFCLMLDQRIEIVKRLHRERKRYIDLDCDKFDWFNSGTSQQERLDRHQRELDNVNRQIKNFYQLRKRFCP